MATSTSWPATPRLRGTATISSRPAPSSPHAAKARKAADLIEKGIAKGNLKRPDDAKLRLGLAQLMTPALKAKGTQTLRAIDAKDGTADVARLWLIGG